MKKKFHDLLHRYKVESFKATHNLETDESLAREIQQFTEHALNDAFHYHFHRDPSPERLETFTMIKHYVLESLMPPVIDKVMRRLIATERQHKLMVGFLQELLETLSGDGVEAGSHGNA